MSSNPPPIVQTAIIPNGASVSNAWSAEGRLVGITMVSGAWTGAGDMTFEWSVDGLTTSTWYQVADGSDGTVAIRTVKNAALILAYHYPLSLVSWLSSGYLRLRSGTSAAPVNQGAARTFLVSSSG